MKLRLSRSGMLIWILCITTVLLGIYGRDIAKLLDARWLAKYPAAWRIPFKTSISDGMKWLVEEASIGPVSFTDITRAFAWLIEQPYELVLALLASGFVSGQGADAITVLPAISWIVVTVAVIALRSLLPGLGFSCFSRIMSDLSGHIRAMGQRYGHFGLSGHCCTYRCWWRIVIGHLGVPITNL